MGSVRSFFLGVRSLTHYLNRVRVNHIQRFHCRICWKFCQILSHRNRHSWFVGRTNLDIYPFLTIKTGYRSGPWTITFWFMRTENSLRLRAGFPNPFETYLQGMLCEVSRCWKSSKDIFFILCFHFLNALYYYIFFLKRYLKKSFDFNCHLEKWKEWTFCPLFF